MANKSDSMVTKRLREEEPALVVFTWRTQNANSVRTQEAV